MLRFRAFVLGVGSFVWNASIGEWKLLFGAVAREFSFGICVRYLSFGLFVLGLPCGIFRAISSCSCLLGGEGTGQGAQQCRSSKTNVRTLRCNPDKGTICGKHARGSLNCMTWAGITAS